MDARNKSNSELQDATGSDDRMFEQTPPAWLNNL